MSYDEYWHGPADLTKHYLRAFEEKRKIENYNAWQSGLYTYKAVVAALSQCFASKDSEGIPYLSKPIEWDKNGSDDAVELTEEEEAQLADVYMNRFCRMLDDR
jgi:hypothetical protein